ncbi:hypothetical protein AB6A40_003702 [Gnathostoma spinigerum]|uniref:adenylate cyclase n=1 Tax=Gnathostoma spinigerum TaxID=75299 RepID=A0ABD6EJ41_9BILA
MGMRAEDVGEETRRMLASEHPDNSMSPVANGSGDFQGTLGCVDRRSVSPKREPLFERASARWWNPQFASASLESQYWKCSFPQLRDRFRSGLIYVSLVCLLWIVYLQVNHHARLIHWMVGAGIVTFCFILFFFTFFSVYYQRFYMPASFLCVFVISLLTLLIFSDTHGSFMSPVGALATSFQVVLLIYTVIPLPLYLCIVIGILYSTLFVILSANNVDYTDHPGVKFILHLGIHLLGIHLFILTQVRQRKTFLKVGQSLLARKDLELETQFKDHMIQSVMPKKVADELLKETSELRRQSSGQTHNKGGAPEDNKNGTVTHISSSQKLSVPNVRTFRPFTMNLMSNVSILFADIAGFTKMSSNKSADELVNLLNDLFGRFDVLCGKCHLEKISTLGDCYYCVAGCPEPRPDHARCCVEMGLAMIIAIRQFDLDRGQDVNMRVGIHTGKVMCGMVGTKRFKFDVFSNDVTYANEMESTGISGRVHISEATAKFLSNEYILEDGNPHKGLKTYFIAGRVQDAETVTGTESMSDSNRVGSVLDASSASQMSLKKKLSGRLKLMHSNFSGGLRGGNTVLNSGGSLRMKLLEKGNETYSVQMLHHSECIDKNSTVSRSPVDENRRKSASMQALSSTDNRPLGKAERIGGKISRDLVNASSSCSARGSRSSGLQDLGSEAYSVGGGIDTAISHHQHAASLTRFDTDNRDFDQRLAQIIQNVGVNFTAGFASHNDSLNRWTLRFNEESVEKEYRRHFAESVDKQRSSSRERESRWKPDATSSKTEQQSTPQYQYSGVFVDIVVSGLLLLVCLAVFVLSNIFGVFFFVYFAVSLCLLFVIIFFIGIPLLKKRTLIPCLSLWSPRHILGMMLMLLPIGLALSVMPICKGEQIDAGSFCISSALLNHRVVFSYVFLVALFGHCNFSQLGAWPKSIQALTMGVLFIILTYLCRFHLAESTAMSDGNNTVLSSSVIRLVCNRSVAIRALDDFGSPIFIGEIILNVFLTVILVAFLNYQFETAFRMSFYGDVQARRDTQKMQAVRDQADWLLTNIIPQHALNSLKSSTKYSENHSLTAVLFATITNWGDMYEETFEGGREFLRVLNEIIGDFDELLDRPEFSQVEKIKTIGPTYMAASGLNPAKRRLALHPYEHLYQLTEFAIGLQQQLSNFNQDLLNFELVCKIGLNIGPVTAGVIGTTKLYYDIWGDTVNIASRMYSTGVENRIQVSQKTRDILCERYDFVYRDHIEVKGIDGGMDTYLLVGRKGEPPINFSHRDD